MSLAVPGDPRLSARFQPPPALHRGDRVAVVAPASGFDRASFDAGLTLIGERYRPSHGPGLFERHRYLAGDDARRLAELTAALADPQVRGLFCARGGYGATRLLRHLAAQPPPGPPKPLVGFSDITALHLWLQAHGRVSIHGPVLTQLPRLAEATRLRLFDLLESDAPAPALRGSDCYVGGVAEGPLLGGNLSVLSRVLATRCMPDLEGAVLLLEDQGERPYRLDRMWTHLDARRRVRAGARHRARHLHRLRGTGRRLLEHRGAARTRPGHRAALRRRLPDRARHGQRAGAARGARAPRRRRRDVSPSWRAPPPEAAASHSSPPSSPSIALRTSGIGGPP